MQPWIERDISRFQSEKLGSNNNKNSYGFNIIIDKSVEVTESVFSIDFVTLLTRIGGAVGVGKECLWIIFIILNKLTDFY